MSRARALILAAGHGTRLRPLTDRMPKCLVPVAGRSLLDYWLLRLADAGVREAVINTHAHADQVERHLDRLNGYGGFRLRAAHEPELLGSAGTLTANADLADDVDHVLVIYADNLSDMDLAALLAAHAEHDDPVTMALFRTPHPSACGIAELDDEDRIVRFVEKPAPPDIPPGNLANAGVYVFDADAYREAAAMNAFDIGFDVLPRFVGRMRGWRWEGYHRDIGTPEAHERAAAEVQSLDLPWQPGQPRPAVFFDRDGTLIEQVEHIRRPEDVRLLPHAAETLRNLRAAGYAIVVVSNQSAVGRGRSQPADVVRVNERMCELLAEQGAVVDALDYCPAVPGTTDRTIVEHPDRKPGPGMLRRAAEALDLDLAASWMVGDLISDVLAGHNAGCRGNILVSTGHGASEDELRAVEDVIVCADLEAVQQQILNPQPTPQNS